MANFQVDNSSDLREVTWSNSYTILKAFDNAYTKIFIVLVLVIVLVNFLAAALKIEEIFNFFDANIFLLITLILLVLSIPLGFRSWRREEDLSETVTISGLGIKIEKNPTGRIQFFPWSEIDEITERVRETYFVLYRGKEQVSVDLPLDKKLYGDIKSSFVAMGKMRIVLRKWTQWREADVGDIWRRLDFQPNDFRRAVSRHAVMLGLVIIAVIIAVAVAVGDKILNQ